GEGGRRGPPLPAPPPPPPHPRPRRAYGGDSNPPVRPFSHRMLPAPPLDRHELHDVTILRVGVADPDGVAARVDRDGVHAGRHRHVPERLGALRRFLDDRHRPPAGAVNPLSLWVPRYLVDARGD